MDVSQQQRFALLYGHPRLGFAEPYARPLRGLDQAAALQFAGCSELLRARFNSS